jgi:hypothetical protein
MARPKKDGEVLLRPYIQRPQLHLGGREVLSRPGFVIGFAPSGPTFPLTAIGARLRRFGRSMTWFMGGDYALPLRVIIGKVIATPGPWGAAAHRQDPAVNRPFRDRSSQAASRGNRFRGNWFSHRRIRIQPLLSIHLRSPFKTRASACKVIHRRSRIAGTAVS